MPKAKCISRFKETCVFAIEDKQFIVDLAHKELVEKLTLRVRNRPTGMFQILVAQDRTYKYLAKILHRTRKGYVHAPFYISKNKMDLSKHGALLIKRSQRLHMAPARKRQKSSIFKGVYLCQKLNKWRASIERLDRAIYLGAFNSEIEAAKAYDDAAIKLFGPHAYQNLKPLLRNSEPN